MDRETTDLLKSHLRAEAKIVFTGKTTDVNTLLRLKPLYDSFVLAHTSFFKEKHGYTLIHPKPGQKAKIFAPFRDRWLPQALQELRAEDEHTPLDETEPTRYLYKKNQCLSRHGEPTGEPCVAAILGWQLRRDARPNEGSYECVKALTLPPKKRRLDTDASEAAQTLLSLTGATGEA